MSKNRILEMYLNVVEWGPDIFGITAASQHYFDKLPSELGPLEASFLASNLPLPARAGEDRWRTQFREWGSIIFDRLVAPCLPRAGPEVEGSSCNGALDEDEARRVDTLAATLIGQFGVKIAAGDGGLLGREEIEASLTVDQQQFLANLTDRFNNDRPPLARRCGRPGEKPNLRAWTQVAGSSGPRIWVPAASAQALQDLMVRARVDGIPLELRSAYRASGYQVFLILRELRLQNYCLSATRRIVESPGRSEHACLDSGALDLALPAGTTGKYEDSEGYRWLLQNTPALGFQLSYEQDNLHGIDFDPWQWRFQASDA